MRVVLAFNVGMFVVINLTHCWIEQGGVSSNITNAGTIVNFNIAFSNANYQVLAQVKKDKKYNELGLTVTNSSTSNFKAYLGAYNGTSPNIPIYWYACGY